MMTVVGRFTWTRVRLSVKRALWDRSCPHFLTRLMQTEPESHPRTIGGYQITGVLGKGAMGVVYKAIDPHIQRGADRADQAKCYPPGCL